MRSSPTAPAGESWTKPGRRPRRTWRLTAALALALVAPGAFAQTPVDEESPWPRVRTTNGHTATLHLPQVESWTSNSFTARAVVELKPAGASKPWVGVAWIAAQGRADHVARIVTLDRLEVTRARFPDAPDQGTNALAILRELVPAGARTLSLDYLVTALGFAQAAARQGAHGLRHAPPEIIWATNRTVLVLIDGTPVLRPVPGGRLQRVVNTPALLVQDGSKFYLAGDGAWFSASAIEGPWSLVQAPPPEVAAVAPATTGDAARSPADPAPRIIVRTRPAELLVTSGLPDFRPIRGTALQYAADTDSLLFFYKPDREAYLLLSGRWFKARSLTGPWTHVPPRELPADFARIPPGTAQAVALASVPGTGAAELAVLANSVPTTATVSRRDATLQVTFDGEPQFKAIDGTSLSYAVNASLPVIRAGPAYYALSDGVWFTATAASGPWQVAGEVPEEIYTIPPNSPVYYATFARVYEATDDTVEVGYTPGYLGAYEDDGTVVYGTGWDYEPWTGDEYYGWGWTWGYSYWYVPWYQWWIWREWWTRPGGLRSALIENIYDRWEGRPGIVHHDRPAAAAVPTTTRRPTAAGSGGYPALYGRFRGAPRPAPLSPPPTTVALNPYTRPETAARPGEIPRGAQLLSQVRQSPGGGRDLYASPDGGIYRRQNDGWYRRRAAAPGAGDPGWEFVAPARGSLERSTLASARGTGTAASGEVYRPVAREREGGGRFAGGGPRVPDTGFEARAQEIAALEREYYARSLAQFRADNWRPANYRARPARGAIRRR